MTTAASAENSKREESALELGSVVDCLSAFFVEVPDESCARVRLFGFLSQNGIVCSCGVIGTPASERSFRCQGCKRLVWVTAHTFFENCRNFLPWMALIWLMEHAVIFNPHQVHKLIGVSPSTAAEMKRKLDCVIAEQMPDDAPTVPSGLFMALFCRRTLETPARAHPREEQSEIDKKSDELKAPDMVPTSGLDDPLLGPLNECEQAVWDCLQEPLDFDRLAYRSGLEVSALNAGLCLLELRGLVKSSRGAYFRVARSGDRKVDTSTVPIEEFIKFVKRVHQGIGRRTLQWYLASFWCSVDHKRWGPGELMAVCLKSLPVTPHQMRKYVSPEFVKIMPRQA